MFFGYGAQSDVNFDAVIVLGLLRCFQEFSKPIFKEVLQLFENLANVIPQFNRGVQRCFFAAITAIWEISHKMAAMTTKSNPPAEE